MSYPRRGRADRVYSTSASRCPVVVCTAANSDTGPRPELLSAIHTSHARHNTPVVVCDISTSRLQGSHRDTPEHDEGYIGDVDKASSWRNGRSEANPGNETSDISEVVLIVDLNTVGRAGYLCITCLDQERPVTMMM